MARGLLDEAVEQLGSWVIFRTTGAIGKSRISNLCPGSLPLTMSRSGV
jgi:hypothetical protein